MELGAGACRRRAAHRRWDGRRPEGCRRRRRTAARGRGRRGRSWCRHLPDRTGERRIGFRCRRGQPGRIRRRQAEVARARRRRERPDAADEGQEVRRGARHSPHSPRPGGRPRARSAGAGRRSSSAATTRDRGRRVAAGVPPGSATEQLHAVLEQGAQGEPPAMDPGLDGAERDAGHLGDLGVVVALDVVEDDRRPLVVGDRGQSAADSARVRSDSERRPLRVGLRRRSAAASSRRRAPGRAGPAGASRARCVSIARVDADPVQPRLDASATERASGCGTRRRTPPGRSRTPGRDRAPSARRARTAGPGRA